jgi:hypothetical protein
MLTGDFLGQQHFDEAFDRGHADYSPLGALAAREMAS